MALPMYVSIKDINDIFFTTKRLYHIFPNFSIVLHKFTYYFLYNMYKNNFTFIKILPLA